MSENKGSVAGSFEQWHKSVKVVTRVQTFLLHAQEPISIQIYLDQAHIPLSVCKCGKSSIWRVLEGEEKADWMTQVATDAVPSTIRQSLCHPNNQTPGPRLAHSNSAVGTQIGRSKWALTISGVITWAVGHRGERRYTGSFEWTWSEV